MQLNELIADDDAVSPVIGVILMVAITVILAAVIASFVLGLGDQAQQTTPQSSFGFDYEGATHNVTITHESGDSIKTSELYVRGSGFNSTGAGNADHTSAGQWAGSASGAKGDTSAVVAGDRAIVHVDSDYEIRVVYQSEAGDNSATLGSDTGPDA